MYRLQRSFNPIPQSVCQARGPSLSISVAMRPPHDVMTSAATSPSWPATPILHTGGSGSPFVTGSPSAETHVPSADPQVLSNAPPTAART